LFIGLVHFPVYNKNHKVVCTSITNLDIHDISRTSKTYGVTKFFIINPQDSQKNIYLSLKKFWKTDIAKEYNICRFNAFDNIEYTLSIKSAKKKIMESSGEEPVIFTTSARTIEKSIDYENAKNIIKKSNSTLILFGTAHGLTDKMIGKSDFHLEKINGISGYNHLSVRSAIAITLDRLITDFK